MSLSGWFLAIGGTCRRVLVFASVGLLAACSSASAPPVADMRQPPPSSKLPPMDVPASPRSTNASGPIPKGGGVYKVGTPYQIAGQWHTPAENPSYDQTGVASWYGSDFHGRRTSNGETYDMNAVTAAHRTLPMPSYVYVTNVANNRTILVRVNDRGPYAHGRIIDLSRTAAEALDVVHHGTGTVRVRYAGPAPLNGDDRKERQFLAAQPWNRGSSTIATARSVPAQTQPVFAQQPAPAAPAASRNGWSADAYRANQRSGLSR
jgi:rare lipoprotein A